jgi:hypothetical protein
MCVPSPSEMVVYGGVRSRMIKNNAKKLHKKISSFTYICACHVIIFTIFFCNAELQILVLGVFPHLETFGN